MKRLTKYSNDLIRNKAVNILRKLDSKNGLDGDELAIISSFCLIERMENKQLKEYEDLEEQNRLKKLPCAVGDKIYLPNEYVGKVIDFEIIEICVFKEEIMFIDDSENEYFISDFGKPVFLTIEEAEAALKELERGKGE